MTLLRLPDEHEIEKIAWAARDGEIGFGELRLTILRCQALADALARSLDNDDEEQQLALLGAVGDALKHQCGEALREIEFHKKSIAAGAALADGIVSFEVRKAD